MNKDFEKIYNENYISVLRFCRTLNSNLHDAEDITSQTFLELFTKFPELDFSEKPPKSWLFTTARFKFYNSIKKSAKLEVSTEYFENYPEIEESFVEKLEHKELCDEVKKIIETFSPQTKEIIVMKLFEEMQFNEIAEIMESTEPAVKMKYYRALEKIKEELEKKKKKVIAFPLIFSAIKDLGLEEKEKSKFKSFIYPSTVGTKNFNKKVILIISLAIILVISLIGFLIYNNFNKNNSDQENKAAEVLPTENLSPSESPTEITSPSPTELVTATPTVTAIVTTIKPTAIIKTPPPAPTTKTYSNAKYGFSMTLPINFPTSVFVNDECQGIAEPAGPGILSCDQLTITDPTSGNQLIVDMAPNNGVTMDLEGSCFGSGSIGSVTILGAARTKNPSTANPANLCYNNANSIVKGTNRIVTYVFNPAGTAPSAAFVSQADSIVSSIR